MMAKVIVVSAYYATGTLSPSLSPEGAPSPTTQGSGHSTALGPRKGSSRYPCPFCFSPWAGGTHFPFPSWQSRIRNHGEMYFPSKEPEAEKTEDLPCWSQQCRRIFCP